MTIEEKIMDAVSYADAGLVQLIQALWESGDKCTTVFREVSGLENTRCYIQPPIDRMASILTVTAGFISDPPNQTNTEVVDWKRMSSIQVSMHQEPALIPKAIHSAMLQVAENLKAEVFN